MIAAMFLIAGLHGSPAGADRVASGAGDTAPLASPAQVHAFAHELACAGVLHIPFFVSFDAVTRVAGSSSKPAFAMFADRLSRPADPGLYVFDQNEVHRAPLRVFDDHTPVRIELPELPWDLPPNGLLPITNNDVNNLMLNFNSQNPKLKDPTVIGTPKTRMATEEGRRVVHGFLSTAIKTAHVPSACRLPTCDSTAALSKAFCLCREVESAAVRDAIAKSAKDLHVELTCEALVSLLNR